MLASLLAQRLRASFAAPSSRARPSLLRRLAGAWQALRSLRRQAADRRRFQRLDAATLRDLGMCRSEFDSFWLEAHGRAMPTRRRTAAARGDGDRS
ncbi:hypothetical protein [Piscinibacter sp. XHJ-5]|uniref:hypothetical protein n=1 Tax=Piscinibacter sp. XHJ-5 TaxID=3037797 RepID=UPI00245323C7|nr:hypothetical protein [Piscinibacter sp. XHJ-5]